MSRPVAVYRCFDADGRLLYVGQSRDSSERLRLYASEGRAWVADVAEVTHEWYQHRTDALLAERAAIRDERPLFPSDVWSAQARYEAERSLASDLRMTGMERHESHRHARKLLRRCGYFGDALGPVHPPLTASQIEQLVGPHEALAS